MQLPDLTVDVILTGAAVKGPAHLGCTTTTYSRVPAFLMLVLVSCVLLCVDGRVGLACCTPVLDMCRTGTTLVLLPCIRGRVWPWAHTVLLHTTQGPLCGTLRVDKHNECM
jgi:hypothetical protein